MIRWIEAAQLDLTGIAEWLAERNPAAAARIVEEVIAGIARLEVYPHLGRPGRREGTRELEIGRRPYFVVYVVRDVEIVIVRVLHGARSWPLLPPT